MSRNRVAAVLAAVAVLCVAATAAVAVTRGDEVEPEPTLAVTSGGASFEVPAEDWIVEEPSVRIFYADERDRPLAVVRGPAVYRSGYCGPDSNQGFAGFTRHGLQAWTSALGEPREVDREQVTVADGTEATLARVVVDVVPRGRCSVPEVEVSMVEAGGVRVVLVRDAGALADDDLLLSLELP